FNVRGEPIVCSPEDAFRCFMRTEMDYLAIGNYLLKTAFATVDNPMDYLVIAWVKQDIPESEIRLQEQAR
ncbi:MAG: carbamoyltransferase C-terminal domain-containing protein, partial [Verrucomicrobiota bacterium]